MARKLVLALLLTALTAGTSEAQATWKIELFNDAEMSTCTVSYSAPGVIQIHVFHTGDLSSTASSFALYPPACMAGSTWLGDVVNPDFLGFGNSQLEEGLAVAYRVCTPTPIHVGYVNFHVSDVDVSCCQFAVSDPLHDMVGIDGVTCDPMTMWAAQGGKVVVNPLPECPCEISLAVETKTWGQIKALYR